MATSDTQTLLNGENVLMSSDGGILTLTNLRVRLDLPSPKSSRYVSIMLNSVASGGVVNRSKPYLLGAAALAVCGGLVLSDAGARVGLFVMAVVFVGVYLATRSAMLTITSTGGEKISVPAKGMAREEVIAFVDAVDSAKLAFLVARSGGVANSIDGPVLSAARAGR